MDIVQMFDGYIINSEADKKLEQFFENASKVLLQKIYKLPGNKLQRRDFQENLANLTIYFNNVYEKTKEKDISKKPSQSDLNKYISDAAIEAMYMKNYSYPTLSTILELHTSVCDYACHKQSPIGEYIVEQVGKAYRPDMKWPMN